MYYVDQDGIPCEWEFAGYIWSDDILKHSPNIIDLIEEGDYVNGEIVECFRLMGVRDEDFDKVAKNQSDSSLYHLAGDSIVVNVLMAIFKELM